MTLTIDIPEKIVERAAELGVSVSALVSEAFDVIVPEPAPARSASQSRSEATLAIREIARTHTLEGLKVKDLIEEGRRL